MKVFNIRLSTIEEVRNFVNIVSKYDFEIDLKSGRYVVDAKSIMGILRLDLLILIELTVLSADCDALMEDLKPMIVD